VPCDEYRSLVEKRGGGKLPPEQERLLSDHLPACESCRKAVRLHALDDAAVGDALLGFSGSTAGDRHASRRLVRLGVLAATAIGIVLLTLWGLYRSFEEQARTDERKRQGHAALDRLVLPRSLERVLPVVLGDLAKQAGAPIVAIPNPAGDATPTPRVTLDLEHRVRLRSALSLLSEFYGRSFLVGEDRVVFPDPAAPPPESDPTEELRRSLRDVRVTLNYDGDDLAGALLQVKTVKGLNLVIAPAAAGKVAAARARLEVRDVPLDVVLDRLLTPAGLRWGARHEVVVID